MKSILKLYLPILLILIMVSCKEDRFEGNEITDIYPVKIDSVKIAQDTMYVFSVQTIKTYSDYMTNCEGFYGYDYIHADALTRNVIPYKFKTAVTCGEEKAKSSQINFSPQLIGTYKFKFWNGKNSSGENIWIEKEIVVE